MVKISVSYTVRYGFETHPQYFIVYGFSLVSEWFKVYVLKMYIRCIAGSNPVKAFRVGSAAVS